MKPPVDWSPCQQKGEEHEWKKESVLLEWYCSKCGVIIRNLDIYG